MWLHQKRSGGQQYVLGIRNQSLKYIIHVQNHIAFITIGDVPV